MTIEIKGKKISNLSKPFIPKWILQWTERTIKINGTKQSAWCMINIFFLSLLVVAHNEGISKYANYHLEIVHIALC